MANGVQVVPDIFGAGRLAQQIRANREEAERRKLLEQQSVTTGLQQQLLRGQVQKQQGALSDLEMQRQQQKGLMSALSQDTGESQTLKRINFLKKVNPQAASQLFSSTLEQAEKISKFNPQAGVDFVNSELGLNFKLIEETPETYTIDQVDKISVVSRKTNDVIKEFPKGTKPTEPKETPLITNLLAAGFKRGTPEFKERINKALTKPDTSDEKDLFDKASKMRGEISKVSKTFDDTTNAYGRVLAVTRNPSAAGDLALIFNFMKMLDPGSVVRESEFRTAEDARAWLSKAEESGVPVPGFVVQGIQKLSTGQKLLPEQRADFLTQSGNIFEELEERHNTTIDNFVNLAKRFGLEREDIIVEKGKPTANLDKKPGKDNGVVTATNPQTGERIQLIDGVWQPIEGD